MEYDPLRRGVAELIGAFTLTFIGAGSILSLHLLAPGAPGAQIAFFGLVATCGTAYAQALFVPRGAWLAGAATGSLATAILVVNNLRDRETDAKVGKNTLAVKIGPAATRAQYVALVAAPFVLAPLLGTLWPLLAFPVAVPALRTVLTKEGRELNRGLGQTARLQILYSLLLAAGLWL